MTDLSIELVAPSAADLLVYQLQVLRQGNFTERWQASQSLVLQGDAIVPGLLELMATAEGADEELCWFITRMLGQLAHPEVIPALVRLLEHPQPDVRTQAFDSLANLGPAAISPLSQLLATTETRRLAVRGLAAIDHPNVAAPLLRVAQDPDPRIRESVLSTLGRYAHPEALSQLQQGLTDPEAAVRQAAIRGLGRFALTVSPHQQTDLVQRLARLLWDVQISVCVQVATVLGRLGTTESVTALFERLQHPAPAGLQQQILRSLGRVGSPQALQWLRVLLLESANFFPAISETSGLDWQQAQSEIIAILGRSESARGRSLATQILLCFWQQDGQQPLTAGLKQALAYSLGQLAQPESTAALTELLADADDGVRLHAQAALRRLGTTTD